MPVLSLEAMCPSQCCWAKISVAAGLVLLEGSGGKRILASSVSRAGLCLLFCGPPFLDLCLSPIVLSYPASLLQRQATWVVQVPN